VARLDLAIVVLATYHLDHHFSDMVQLILVDGVSHVFVELHRDIPAQSLQSLGGFLYPLLGDMWIDIAAPKEDRCAL
jgi:hypothetical protein